MFRLVGLEPAYGAPSARLLSQFLHIVNETKRKEQSDRAGHAAASCGYPRPASREPL